MRQRKAALALWALLGAGCSGPKDHPPLLDSDCDANCGTIGGTSAGLGGSSSTSGTAGTATSGGATSDAGVDVQIAVLTTTDERFTDTQRYAGNVRVGALAADGSEVSGLGVAGAIEIQGAAAGVNWFAVEDDPIGLDIIFPTLLSAVVDPSNPQLSLAAIPSMTFTNTLLSSDLPSPIAGAAQAIVTFEQNGLPLSGVKLQDDAPEGGFGTTSVAYDAGGIYEPATSSQTSATGVLGTALLLNWSALPYFSGSTTTVLFTPPGGTTHKVDIVLAQDFVTRVYVALQ